MIVGLGNHGREVVDLFMQSLPEDLRASEMILPLTFSASEVPRSTRLDGPVVVQKYLMRDVITRVISSPGVSTPSSAYSQAIGSKPFRVVVVTSPFESVPVDAVDTLLNIQSLGYMLSAESVQFDVIMLAEFSGGPAGRSQARGIMEELAIRQAENNGRPENKPMNVNLVWLDHTDEAGNSLRKDRGQYYYIARRSLEFLLTAGRDQVISDETLTAGQLTMTSIGFSALELPLAHMIEAGCLVRMSEYLEELTDYEPDEMPADLYEITEDAISLDSTDGGIVNTSEAARRARRLTDSLRSSGSLDYMLGAEPHPQLDTLKAGLDQLLDQASSQAHMDNKHLHEATERVSLAMQHIDDHLKRGSNGLAEARAVLGYLSYDWKNREADARSRLVELRAALERQGRKVAWLSGEHEKKRAQASWRQPMLTALIKSAVIMILLAGGTFGAISFLPELSPSPYTLTASVAGISFFASFMVFMFMYFQERAVIPEMIVELVEHSEMRLDLIDIEEEIRFFGYMANELTAALDQLEQDRRMLHTSALNLQTQASRGVRDIADFKSDYHTFWPPMDYQIIDLLDELMGGDDFIGGVRAHLDTFPKTKGQAQEIADNVVRWGLAEVLPQMQRDPRMSTTSVVQNYWPGHANWPDIVAQKSLSAPPWWRSNGFAESPIGKTTINRYRIVYAKNGDVTKLQMELGGNGTVVVDGSARDSIAIINVVSGIPLEFAIGPMDATNRLSAR